MTGKETDYIKEAVALEKISGDGEFSKKCHRFFERRFGFKKALLTTSCTDALEMAAILAKIDSGDEVILPSYTFVSTANAFVLRGAKLVFVDCESERPNMDASLLESLITARTKAIVPVHYAGMACNMDEILAVARRHNLFVIEDAAQAIDSYYKGKPLGGIGNLAAFSFHETKNVISGEGGMLTINDPQFQRRAEIIREKGTNRSAFFRGEVDKYGWVDIGSSFLPSDIIAAFLYAQLEHLDMIQSKRLSLWNRYYEALKPLTSRGVISVPNIPPYATNNAHMFYIVFNSLSDRTRVISHLKKMDIQAVFHYLSLHTSPFYKDKHDGRTLPHADRFTDTLLRLPMFFELKEDEIAFVAEKISECF